MEKKIVRAHIVVKGQVQGVFYRINVSDEAKELGLSGWIKNLPNGDVEAVFEGPENLVKEMLLWCREGPKLAKVKDMQIFWEKPTGEFKGLKVIHD